MTKELLKKLGILGISSLLAGCDEGGGNGIPGTMNIPATSGTTNGYMQYRSNAPNGKCIHLGFG